MVERRRGLGRGLGALIPSGEPETQRKAAGSQNEATDEPSKPESGRRRQRTGSVGGAEASKTSGNSKNAASTGKAPKTGTAGKGAPSSKRTTTSDKATSRSSGTDAVKKAGSGAKKSTKATAVEARSAAGAEEMDKSTRTTAGKASSDGAKTVGARKSSNGAGAGAAAVGTGSERKNAVSPEGPGAHADIEQSAMPSGLAAETTQGSARDDSSVRKDHERDDDVSRETSSAGASRPGGRSKDSTGRPAQRRRDMGQALRSTTNVSRPVDMFFLPSDPDSFSEAPSSPVGTSGATPDGDGDTWRATHREGASSVSETSTPDSGRNSSLAHGPTASPADDQKTRSDLASKQVSSTGASDVSRETSATKGSDPTGSQNMGEDLTVDGARTRDEDTSVPVESSPETAPDSSAGVPTDGAGITELKGDGGDLRAVPGATFAELAVTDIHPNRKQPRQVFDEDELAELAFSVKELGVLQPIVVRPSRDGGPEAYELVMGERRWRAVQAAGMSTIPAIVRETADNDLLRDALLENLHRAQLNPLEEAAAYQQLMEEFGATQEQLSERIGRSRPQISNTLRLLRLPALVQRRVAAGVLSSGHARALLALTDPAEMERLAQRIVAEGLSVRATEEAVALSDGLKRQSTRRKAPSTRHDDRLGYIADAFSDKLDTSVKIQLGARKGKMTIEFASVEDLNRIIDVLDPKLDSEN